MSSTIACFPRRAYLKIIVTAVLALAGLLSQAFPALAAGDTPAGPGCQFTQGFKAIHDDAPDVVGACLGDAQGWPDGRVVQLTTGGVLVWDKARNVSVLVRHRPDLRLLRLASPDTLAVLDNQLADPLIALASVNALRAMAGEAPVTLDAAASRDATAHARYLVLNNGALAIDGLNSHDENLALPGATPAGQTAARRSNILHGAFRPPSPLYGAFVVENVPLHAAGFLNPALRRLGIGFYRDNSIAAAVFDVSALDATDQQPAAVPWPVPEARDVPVTEGGEIPEPRQMLPQPWPVGHAVSLLPYQCGAGTAQASLTHDGQPVPAVLVQAGATLTALGGERSLSSPLLFPREPLLPGTWYSADFQLSCGSRTFSRQWRFRTEPRGW